MLPILRRAWEVDLEMRSVRTAVVLRQGAPLKLLRKFDLLIAEKSCQSVDWMQHNHKANCKGFSFVRQLLIQDWESFDKYLRFPL